MEASSTTSRHVLLIDAESYVWDVVTYALGGGYRVSAVAFRSAALRVLGEHPPHAMIVDLRANALGLPMAIYGLRRHIPVVMTTTNQALARRLTRLGGVILRKPFSPFELRAAIDEAMANPDDNLLRHRATFERLQTDHREREAVLRLFGNSHDDVLLALRAAHANLWSPSRARPGAAREEQDRP
jgi:DNA-binding response OmpR family regulator